MYERVRRDGHAARRLPVGHTSARNDAGRGTARGRHTLEHLADPTPVVQRWLAPQILKQRPNDRRTTSLTKLVTAYQENRRGKSRATRIDQLHDVQVELLHALDAMTSPDLSTSPTANWMRALMNDVQREHIELVTLAVGMRNADPPIAHFADLDDTLKRTVRRMWNDLVNGNANVRITEDETYTAGGMPMTVQHAGFRFEVLAQFARLLVTEVGRGIVADVQANTSGQRLVTIKPGLAKVEDGRKREFAAGPAVVNDKDKLLPFDMNAALNAVKGKPNAAKRRAAIRAQFIPLALDPQADIPTRAKAVYQARRSHPGARGIYLSTGEYFQFGAGTAVNVTLTRDIPDATDHHTSRVVDEAGDELSFPNFITLGHELGHAAHMIRGTTLGRNEVSDALFSTIAQTPQAQLGNQVTDWSNFEEFATINSVENALRAEYGLRARFGHGNQSTTQKKLLDPVINDTYAIEILFPGNTAATAKAHLANADRHNGALEISETRSELGAALAELAAQVHPAFAHAPPGSRASVVAELETAREHIASAQPQAATDALAALQRALATIQGFPPPPPPTPQRSSWSLLRMFGY